AAVAVRRKGAWLLPGTPESWRRPAEPPWHRKCGSCGRAFRESAAKPTSRSAASLERLRSGSNRQRPFARFRRDKLRFLEISAEHLMAELIGGSARREPARPPARDGLIHL